MLINKLKNSGIKFFRSIFRWIVPLWFWIYRWLKDQEFLVNLQSRSLRPGFLSHPIWLIMSVCKLIKKSWASVYIDYGMQRYSTWVGEHYSPTGRGYFNYGNLSELEKTNLYGKPRGRIEYFLKSYPRTLKYEDGQSILDAGCGRGQNVKVLSEYFPASKIKAFDLSEEALSVVELGVENQKQIQADVGSITDINYLKQYPTNGFDHVLVSHVFPFIMSGSEAATLELRQNIIDELVRISSKTLLILGGNELLQLEERSFKIEQLKRATFAESIARYFDKHLNHGEVYAVFSPESIGLLFLCDNKNTNIS
jgi:SAM-dependent methyltransferase